MRRDEALKVLSEHKSELRQKFGVKSIAIFGSTARGEVTPQSDIDVLVGFNPLAAPSLLDFIHLKHFLSDKLNGKVDLVERRSLIPLAARRHPRRVRRCLIAYGGLGSRTFP